MKRGESNGRKSKSQEQRDVASKEDIYKSEKQAVSAAHDQAEKDMMEDAELTASSPNDDLDEGESARLGEEKTDMV